MKVANISPCVSNSGLTRFTLSGFCDSLIRHILVRESRTTDTLIKIFNNHITLLKLKKGLNKRNKIPKLQKFIKVWNFRLHHDGLRYFIYLSKAS